MNAGIAKWIIDHNGECPNIDCDNCFGGCESGRIATHYAEQWLADHPETKEQSALPRYVCDACQQGPCYFQSAMRPRYCPDENSYCEWEEEERK